MADISIIHEGNTDYNVKDAAGREALAVVENKGAKNLLKLGFTHKTAGNQTVDMTADGNGIIVNGDRNTTTDVILVGDLVTNQSTMLDTRYTLAAGKYVMTSTEKNILRYQVYCHDGTNSQSLGYTTNEPLEFEYTTALKTQYPYIAYRLWASRVSSFDNFTTYPMICTKEEWDISHTYVPYGKTNAELTNDTSTLFTENTRQETEIGVVANAGAKNFASKNSGSGTNSTAIPKTPITLPVGDYICSFSASSYSGNAAFELWDASNSQQYVKELTVAGSNSFKFTVTGAMSVAKYSLYVNNATISDFMIRPAAITDPTFQPYAPTNRELYAGEFQNSMTSLVDNLNVTFIDKANSRLNVYKYGKICFADISLKTNASALTGSDTITATALPSELRPTSTIYAALTARDVGSWVLANLVAATVSIDANGVATLRTGAAHSSAEYIIGYISWLAVT